MYTDNHNDSMTEPIIGAAIAVHRELGPGYLESIYEQALYVALDELGVHWLRQHSVAIHFHGRCVGEHRLDLLVANRVIVELKALSEFLDLHIAVCRSYLRATRLGCGLLMNFAGPTLQVKRIGPDFRPRS